MGRYKTEKTFFFIENLECDEKVLVILGKKNSELPNSEKINEAFFKVKVLWYPLVVK